MRHGRRRGVITAVGVVTLALCHVASAEAWYQPAGGASPINESPTDQAFLPSLATIDGVPYVAWYEDDGTNNEIRVSKLDGGAWTQVGDGSASPINQDPSRDAFDPSLASIGGVPYVAWTEFDGVNNELRVSKLNAAGTAWTEVGDGSASPINQDPSRGADAPSLASIGGVPYVAWSELDGASFEIRVSKLDGGDWTQVVGGESPINQDSNRAARDPSLASVDGVPYVAWSESDGTNSEIRVSKLNAAGTDWTQVEGGASPINQDPVKDGLNPSLASTADAPYVAWSEFDATNSEIRVSKLNEAGTDWTQVVGGASPVNNHPSTSGLNPSLASIADVPYVAWAEGDGGNYEVRVSKLNGDGTAWLQIAIDFASPVNEDPSRNGEFPSLAEVGDVPFVAWQEFDGINTEIRVGRDEQRLNFSSADYSTAEGSSPATIAVHRKYLAGPVTVDYETSDGTASEPDDYAATSGTLAFADGDPTETFTVSIVDDVDLEPDETIQLALSNPDASPILAVLDPPSAATLTITDDDTIDTLITGEPGALINQPIAVFSFAADKPAGATFVCSVDAVAPTPCTSPLVTPALADGPHSFSVRASSPTAGTDPSPAQRNFFVDTVAPATTIAIAPVPGFGFQVGGAATYAGSVSIGHSMSDPEPSGGGITVRCSFDPASPPATFDDLDPACPLTTSALGTHTVYAASRDFAGNVGPVASLTFTILSVPETTITDGPSGPTWEMASAFEFSSDVAGSTFECRVDGAAFAPCRSVYLTSALASGPHSLDVRATSPDGVVDPTPAHRNFSVNFKDARVYRCQVQPFPVKDPDEPGLGACFFGDCATVHAHVDFRNAACKEFAYSDCPAGALCRIETQASWFDADPRLQWAAYASASGTSGDYGPASHCSTDAAGDRCGIKQVTSGLGVGRRLHAGCYADYEWTGSRRPADERLGPDSIRRLECDVLLSVEPSAALSATAGRGSSITILAPGAGVLGISPIGGRGKLAAAAKPAFQPQTQTVDAAGPVSFKPKLSKKAKKTLKRKRKLALSLDVTFTPAGGGETLTSTQKVKLTKR